MNPLSLLRRVANVKRKRSFKTSRRLPSIEMLERRQLLAAWISQGPFGATNGQVENIAGRPVVGAVQALLAHPTNPDILYAGGTNGGVWKTTNATAASPSWTTNTDSQSSLSIGALAFDVADPTFQTLYAGNGLYSSFGRIGGGRDGLLRSFDGGSTWTRITGGGVLVGKGISGIVANGQTITVSVNIADSFTYSNIGIYRSNNGGTTFTPMSNLASTFGLPQGIAYDLAADPTDPDVLYTSVSIPITAGTQGVYKSIDGGANWSRVSNATMDANFNTNTSNVEIATGKFGEVYVAIINGGVLSRIFRSGDSGASWVAMDVPVTNENGTNVGLNPGGPRGNPDDPPEVVAGGQGAIHFSMIADPTDANIVYVGGDRQPRANGDTAGFPNSIGALDFSGRLFRGDASKPAGSQFVHLTHSNVLGATGGGTASSSSPHADSRDMAFDANGNLIESDDGGVYRRTSPKTNTGDWFSMIGNLATTEMHDVAYDTLSNVLISGNQDTGTTYQATSGAATWTSVSTADGGDVAVDTIALAGSNQSIRYSSFQNLGAFSRRVYNAAGTLVSTSFPSLTVVGSGSLSPNFRTPLATNAVAGSRLVIQATNAVFESLDQGSSITRISTSLGTNSIEQDAIAYGGKLGGNSFADVLWIAGGSSIAHRPPSGTLANTASQPTGATTIRDLAVDPDEYTTAAIVTTSGVFFTTNSGNAWSNITGNLPSTPNIRSIAYVPGIVDALVVGTRAGIFATSIGQLGQWFSLGTSFPNAIIPEIVYDSSDDLLVAGTMGRGAWTLATATAVLKETLGAPTNIALSNNVIVENNSISDAIGALSTVDPTSGETFTYTLVAGSGSDDNASFSISGNTLRAEASFNFEAKSTLLLRIRSTDSSGWWTEKEFSISVTDVNEAPSVSLDNVISMLAENANSAGRVKVADVTIQDDALGTETLSISGTDSAKFELDANVLYVRSGVAMDYETKINYSIQVNVDDNTLGAFPDASAAYTLTLTDVNEFSVTVPIDSDSNTDGIAENAPIGSIVGITALSIDSDGTTNAVTYTLFDSADGRFQIHPTTGVITLAIANLDFEMATLHTVIVRATSADGSIAQSSFGIPVANVDEPVLLTSNNSSVTGVVGATLSNSGTWKDPENGTVTLSASFGNVIKNNDGTWAWSITTTGAFNQTVTITASDGTNTSSITFVATAFAIIQARSVFYNNATGALLSSAGAAQNAIDTSKSALRGTGTQSTFSNYTNYSRGLNGIIIDITGLPSTSTDSDILSSLQFAQWNGIDVGGFGALSAAAIPSVSLFPGSGENGSTRVKITFPNNTVQNTWLRVTLLSNAFTGLQSNDVFYFGHVLADLDVGNTPTIYRVNADDVSAVRANQSGFPNTANVTNRHDLNKDGRVNADDVSIVRANQQGFGIVAPITVP